MCQSFKRSNKRPVLAELSQAAVLLVPVLLQEVLILLKDTDGTVDYIAEHLFV